MRIESGGNPIADQAKENSEGPMYEFNIGWIPPHFSVKIQYEPAKLDINVKLNKPINNSKARKPIIHYTPGKVSIGMARYNSLKIDFENLKFTGNKFEISI